MIQKWNYLLTGWAASCFLRFSTQKGSRLYSGFSHSLKIHIEREKKLALAQFSTGPRRSGAAIVDATGAVGGAATAGRLSFAGVVGLSAAGAAVSIGSWGRDGAATAALAGFLGSPAALAALAALAAASAAELAGLGADAGRAAETADAAEEAAAAAVTTADTAATGACAFSTMISDSGVARTGATSAMVGGATTATAGTGTGADLPPLHSANPPPIRITAAAAAMRPNFLDGAGAITSPPRTFVGKTVAAANAALA